MATLFYTILGITAGASLHCAVRREISPCTCSPHDYALNGIQVTCDRMSSFTQIHTALKNRFSPETAIWLKITRSELFDLDYMSFADMNMYLKNLKLNNNNISSLSESSFRGLTRTDFLSLTDNDFDEIPNKVFDYMPGIRTLDLANNKIKILRTGEFKSLPHLQHLILGSNNISKLEANSFPSTIVNLHIGKNNLTSLNGTLRNLSNLKSILINGNEFVTLEDELPPNSPYLIAILAHNNKLETLPSQFRTLPNLDVLFFSYNRLRTLGEHLKYSSRLQNLYLSNNLIESLSKDEFLEAENIEDLVMSHNLLRSLNNSLLPIKQLQIANFSYNLIEEFSLKEIAGLNRLGKLDLSHNRIKTLTGNAENQIEPISFIFELRLQNNLLTSLDGSLMGLYNLKILNLANNLLQRILPEDFIGLEKLSILDISNNQLKTLEATSKTFLPSLEILNASYNLLHTLDKDFHGLPVLCLADLSNNLIKSISIDLVKHTKCSKHGVTNKLEILLQENPILCDEDLPNLILAMGYQQARLLGVAHCLVPQLEHEPPILHQPVISTIVQSKVQQPPTILQVFVPVPAPLVPSSSSINQQPSSVIDNHIEKNSQSSELPSTPIPLLLAKTLQEDTQSNPILESILTESKENDQQSQESVSTSSVIYSTTNAPPPMTIIEIKSDNDIPISKLTESDASVEKYISNPEEPINEILLTQIDTTSSPEILFDGSSSK